MATTVERFGLAIREDIQKTTWRSVLGPITLAVTVLGSICSIFGISSVMGSRSPVNIGLVVCLAITFFGAVCLAPTLRIKRRRAATIGTALVGIACLGWAVNAYTVETFEQLEDEIVVRTVRGLLDEKPKSQRVMGKRFLWYGPLSDSGKRQGEWSIDGEQRWYWYGEEISEGEWHLRHK